MSKRAKKPDDFKMSTGCKNQRKFSGGKPVAWWILRNRPLSTYPREAPASSEQKDCWMDRRRPVPIEPIPVCLRTHKLTILMNDGTDRKGGRGVGPRSYRGSWRAFCRCLGGQIPTPPPRLCHRLMQFIDGRGVWGSGAQ